MIKKYQSSRVELSPNYNFRNDPRTLAWKQLPLYRKRHKSDNLIAFCISQRTCLEKGYKLLSIYRLAPHKTPLFLKGYHTLTLAFHQHSISGPKYIHILDPPVKCITLKQYCWLAFGIFKFGLPISLSPLLGVPFCYFPSQLRLV